MPLKYAIEQRLRFIDFLLTKYGHINRSVIVDYFGVGPATATRDFAAYKKLAPANMVLNDPEKTYYRTTSFKSVWI